MNAQRSKQQPAAEQPAAGQPAYERCLCREFLGQLRECFGISPAVQQHLSNSRIEFLKAVRAVIDQRIEHLSTTPQQGTKIPVE